MCVTKPQYVEIFIITIVVCWCLNWNGDPVRVVEIYDIADHSQIVQIGTVVSGVMLNHRTFIFQCFF